MRVDEGVVTECFLSDSAASSILHFIRFPVGALEDWERMRERFRLGDPGRAASE
jgi:hypothetical protein